MTKKKLISLLTEHSISFDFIKNEKGAREYAGQELFIDLENADAYAATGNFSGIEIYNLTSYALPNFEAACKDKTIWNYFLPIQKIDLREMTESQVLHLLSKIGAALTDLHLDYKAFEKLDLEKIVNVCPKLKNLELSDTNWNRHKEISVDLDKIGSRNFNCITCNRFAIYAEVNWSALNISSLFLNECDTSTIIFPSKLKTLDIVASDEQVTIRGGQALNKLSIQVIHASPKKIDFSVLTNLKELDLKIIAADKAKLKLPMSLTALKIVESSNSLFSLKFLDELKGLEFLSVASESQGCVDYRTITDLSNLKSFKLDEKGIGNSAFKSDFQTSFLKGLKKLEELEFKYIMNLHDFTFIKDLKKLNSFSVSTGNRLSF